MPKPVTVILDGNEYTITEKRSRENAAWRRRLEGPFAELADLLEGGPSTEITDMASLAALVRSASGLLIGSIDTIRELLADYATELPLDDAYDSEIMDAFVEVLGLAFPFGQVVNKIRGLRGR